MSQQHHQNQTTFIIQSKIDNQRFTIDRKVIDASTLLKNIYDITEVTEPILIDCPSESLNVFIKIINNYHKFDDKEEENTDDNDEEDFDFDFEENLYNSFTSNDKKQLIKLIQDLCILDSDIFLDSISDYILGIFNNEEKGIEMDWKEIQEYLGIENDFSKKERNLIENSKKHEFFLSINFRNMKFPFQNKNLYCLKTDFSTPMNSLIARIIQRSNAKTSYLLSLINKTIKNEVDRMPCKVEKCHFSTKWQQCCLYIKFKKLQIDFRCDIEFKDFDKKYSNIFKRKVKAEDFVVSYVEKLDNPKLIFRHISPDFVIANSMEIQFYGFKSMYQFDVTKCKIPYIYCKFCDVNVKEVVEFDEVYNHLIAKDLTKSIRIMTHDFFNITDCSSLLAVSKRSEDLKFKKITICDQQNASLEFKKFITNYMEDDGIVKSRCKFDGSDIVKIDGWYEYPVLDVKKVFGLCHY